MRTDAECIAALDRMAEENKSCRDTGTRYFACLRAIEAIKGASSQSTQPDFRARTCGECDWRGPYAIDTEMSHKTTGYVDVFDCDCALCKRKRVQKIDPACPAYVSKEPTNAG